jgi:hypothetical protein
LPPAPLLLKYIGDIAGFLVRDRLRMLSRKFGGKK